MGCDRRSRMAERRKGTTMDSSSCEWVRERLPLLVEDSEDISDEGADLSTGDRLRLEHHLGGCKPCRDHRTALVEALAVLTAVASEPPVETGGGSVWPDLEVRIRRHRWRSQSRWPRLLRATC